MVHQGLRLLPRLATAALLALAACSGLAPPEPPPEPEPPAAPREFRGAWIASVANIDWPSRPGLPVAEQQAEIRRIADRARDLGLNALIVQVRPAADALYPSTLEPWSEYLTGEQGKAPEPFYDPLALWIEEAHRRGLELHAWFNPYRARHPSAKGPFARNHLAVAAPHLAKTYGTYAWLDPGEAAASQHTLAVVLDVVRRYDIDGVHIDDYFYPYPVAAPAPQAGDLPFPDDPAWERYRGGGGALSREDWRRQNVNALVARLHADIHREKHWVRFGISPFGLGRPDRRPPGIAGFSQYDKLYADVELWLARGWLDYLAPQLYWPIDQAPQAFGVLLDYWQRENSRGRHVWPGLFTSRIDATPRSWAPAEIASQVALSRAKASGGHIHFSMVALADNRQGIADRLKAEAYASPALVPATPWLADTPPAAPAAVFRRAGADAPTFEIAFSPVAGESPWQHAAWVRYGRHWRFHVFPATQARVAIAARHEGLPAEAIVVSAVTRVGVEGPRVAVALPSEEPK